MTATSQPQPATRRPGKPARTTATTTTASTPPRPAPEPPAGSDDPSATDPAALPEHELARWLATASDSQVQAASRAARAPLGYRQLLPPAVITALQDLNDRLSEQICPWTTAELDAVKNDLNHKYPGYDHWYVRSGTTITWCDRKKDTPPAPEATTRATT